jgi:hypothetical protein
MRVVGLETPKSAPRLVERANSIDMMQLATAVGPAPAQVGAILLLRSELGLQQLLEVLAERIPSIPRLRQQLVRTPLGCGRPVWIDDPGFDLARHVHEVVCPPPGAEKDVNIGRKQQRAAPENIGRKQQRPTIPDPAR